MTLAYLFWMSTRSSFPLNALVHRCNSDILYRKSLDWRDNKYQSHMHKRVVDHIFCSVTEIHQTKAAIHIIFIISELVNQFMVSPRKKGENACYNFPNAKSSSLVLLSKIISYMTKKQQILTLEKLQTEKKLALLLEKLSK